MIQQKSYTKEYVELKMVPIEMEMKNLKREQSETKVMVRDIHNYLLRKTK